MKREGARFQPNVEEAITEYVACLGHDLGDRLDSVVLYGSQARGDAVEGSDVDVLVVLEGPFDYGEMLERTSRSTADVSLKYDVVISRTFFSRQDYQSKQTPFLMNVRREAVRL